MVGTVAAVGISAVSGRTARAAARPEEPTHPQRERPDGTRAPRASRCHGDAIRSDEMAEIGLPDHEPVPALDPMPSLLLQPHHSRLGDVLNLRLQDPVWTVWTTFRAAVAFVKRSGVDRIAESLRAFARRGHVRMTFGVDVHGTSVEGSASLLDCLGDHGEIRVFLTTTTARPSIRRCTSSATKGTLRSSSGWATSPGAAPSKTWRVHSVQNTRHYYHLLNHRNDDTRLTIPRPKSRSAGAST